MLCNSGGLCFGRIGLTAGESTHAPLSKPYSWLHMPRLPSLEPPNFERCGGLTTDRCRGGGQKHCSLLSEKSRTRAVPVSTSPTKQAPRQHGLEDADTHSWSTEVDSRPDSRGRPSPAAHNPSTVLHSDVRLAIPRLCLVPLEL